MTPQDNDILEFAEVTFSADHRTKDTTAKAIGDILTIEEIENSYEAKMREQWRRYRHTILTGR